MRGLFCCLISVFLSGFQILGAMEAKPKAEVLQTAKILELPDELISEIILFSLGNGGVSEIESKKYLVKPGKILRKWLLVSKRFHNVVLEQICTLIIPGIKNNKSLWNKIIPYDALYLVINGVDATIDGYVCSEFRGKVEEKMADDEEDKILISAYAIAKEETPVSLFLYNRFETVFDEILVEAQTKYENVLSALDCVEKHILGAGEIVDSYSVTKLIDPLDKTKKKLTVIRKKHQDKKQKLDVEKKKKPFDFDALQARFKALIEEDKAQKIEPDKLRLSFNVFLSLCEELKKIPK